MSNPRFNGRGMGPTNNYSAPSAADQNNGSSQAPTVPQNTLNPATPNEDGSNTASASSTLNIQAVIDRLSTVNARPHESPDSIGSADLPIGGPVVNPERGTPSVRPHHNNRTLPLSNYSTSADNARENTPLANGIHLHPHLYHPSSPRSTTPDWAEAGFAILNLPATRSTQLNGTSSSSHGLTSDSQPPSRTAANNNAGNSSGASTNNVADPSAPPNLVTGSDNTEAFNNNNVDGASSPRDQVAAERTETLVHSDPTGTDQPKPPFPPDIVSTNNPATQPATSSNTITIQTPVPESSTSSNTVVTDAATNPGQASSISASVPTQTRLNPNSVNSERASSSSSTTRVRTRFNFNTLNPGRPSARFSRAFAQSRVNARTTIAAASEPGTSSGTTQTALLSDTVDTGRASSSFPTVPTQTHPDFSTVNTVDSQADTSSDATQTARPRDTDSTGASPSNVSSGTNRTVRSAEVAGSFNRLSDNSTLITNNTQAVGAESTTNLGSNNSRITNTNYTTLPAGPAIATPPRKPSTSNTINTPDTQITGGAHLPSYSTPPHQTAGAPRYSLRVASGVNPLEDQSAQTPRRQVSAPITLPRRRRTMTTDDGSPIRIRPSGSNNGTASDAAQTPHWNFNLTLRNVPFADADSDNDGEPSSTRPGARHHSLPLRRVRASEALRTLSTEHGQNPPLAGALAAPGVNVLGGEDDEGDNDNDDEEEEEEEEERGEEEGEGGVAAPEGVVEGDLPLYNPADDDFMEEEDVEEEEEVGRWEWLLDETRHYLRQVAAEIDILDEIDAAAMARGRGAAVRARLGLVMVEEEVRNVVRAAVQAIERHRERAEQVGDVADVVNGLQVEALTWRQRAIFNEGLLREAQLEMVQLRRQLRNNERRGD